MIPSLASSSDNTSNHQYQSKIKPVNNCKREKRRNNYQRNYFEQDNQLNIVYIDIINYTATLEYMLHSLMFIKFLHVFTCHVSKRYFRPKKPWIIVTIIYQPDIKQGLLVN